MNFSRSNHLVFWCRWVLAAIIGTMAGSRIFDILADYSKYVFTISLSWIATIGVFISLTQWLMLQIVPKIRWWLITSFIGSILSGVIAGTIDEELYYVSVRNGDYHNFFVFIVGACIGVTIGIAQWWSLRQLFPKAKTWIVASALGWALGLMMFRFDFPNSLYATLTPTLTAEFAWFFHIVLLCVPMAGITGFVMLKSPNFTMESLNSE